MADTRYIDGMLVTWGAELFYGRVRSKAGKVKDILPKVKGGEGGRRYSPASAKAVREQLRATFKKVPEVNVKITGSGTNMRHIKAHIDYIARVDEEDVSLHKQLEDQDGNTYFGRDELLDLRDIWRDGRNVIPSEVGSKRETFNVMLSMPPGTDRLGVHNAARDFAKEEFGEDYPYVFTSHDDTAHPHVHLVVKAQGRGGRRLNPRKADLQRWRRGFAEKLREHGIEANATTKRTRGITKHATKKPVIEAEKAGHPLPHYRDRNKNRDNPYAHKTAQTHGKVLRAYKGIAEALQHSPDAADRKLAVELVEFVQAMPYEKELARDRVRSKEKQIKKGPAR